MTKKSISRREFVRQNSLAGAGTVVAMSATPVLFADCSSKAETPALLGGQPVRTKNWPEWPVWNPETDEDRLIKVIRSGVWSRKDVVTEFEKKWAEMIGARRCLAVVNGTNAIIASLVQLGIGGGDEVLVPPYTFIATVVSVFQVGAIPVFVDTDPETFQIDTEKIESKITSRTRAILPVHILGLPADMERIMAIAKKHNLVVIEDACQAWLAEINHKKVGTFGNAGCFSFQNSKNMPIGEGGAIVSDDDKFIDRCYSYHNYGNPYGTVAGEVGAGTLLADQDANDGIPGSYRSGPNATSRVTNRERNENAKYLQSS